MKHPAMQQKLEAERTMHLKAPYPHHDPSRAGAALIIALSVLLVLLSIAITFALIVRYESDMAGMAYEGARAESLLDGALAKAMYRLNRDLEVHPDALSLDHGWRTWYNGAAFVGKTWTREQLGEKAFAPLYFNQQGLVRIDVSERERALAAQLNNGLLYVQFTSDRQMEPLFRGPRTEHWLHVPRYQENLIVLYAEPGEARLVNNEGQPVDVTARQNAGIYWFHELDADNPPPFVTADFFYPGDSDNDIPPALPAGQVNDWADVDTTGDGMRDALWTPIARDVDHYADWIDNTLDGLVDPSRNGTPLFESAPFVYREAQARFDYETGLWTPPYEIWGGTPGEQLWLTVPLPGMTMQVDLNSDGVFDERDHYCDEFGNCGPVFVRLPDIVQVTTITDLDSLGNPIIGSITLTRDNVDVRDNNYDLFVNSFRNYAYIGPHAPLSGDAYQQFYFRNQIPAARDEDPARYNRWMPYEDIAQSDPSWHWSERDRQDALFAAANHRAYHDINVDAAFGGPDNLEFFFVNQNGDTGTISPALDRILRRPNALRITCSGEPVSEIVGRAAIHIADEAGKANINTAGGYVHVRYFDDSDGVFKYRFQRALHQGVSSFEYETRILPYIGVERAPDLWGMRTGALQINGFEPNPTGAQYDRDAAHPGYGRVDDNGNALLLALSGRDDSGSELIDDGLHLPRITPNPATLTAIQEFVRTETIPSFTNLLADMEFREWLPYWSQHGRFEGIDEPQELRLFNPLRNLVAEFDTDFDYDIGDRLFLRKEELTRHHEIRSDGAWSFLRNLVTVNSDTRNIFAVQGHGVKMNFLKIDPNTATPQQLAATLLIQGDVSNIADGLWTAGAGRDFADGLRQFDRSYEGHLFGQADGVFPADPVLQTVRLALDIVSARDRNAQRHRLITENLIRNPHTYADYLQMEIANFETTLPQEQINERERILDHELMPVGDVQEYLNDALGVTPDDKRLIAPDRWWKEQTGEDRLFQYAAASTDAIRINEIMARPVRRVEAETQPLPGQSWSWDLLTLLEAYYNAQGMTFDATPYADNLNPAPYDGMLSFDVVTPPPFIWPSLVDINEPAWRLQSAYDYPLGGNLVHQPLLGERTAWTYEAPPPDPSLSHWPISPTGDFINPDIIEFRFRPSDGLPPGRYYLKVNVTDQFGNMTVVEPGVLDYTIKYAIAGDDTDTISADISNLLNLYAYIQLHADPGDLDVLLSEVAAIINGFWHNVDDPAFIASTAARNAGSAAPPGWLFLPSRWPVVVVQNVDGNGFDIVLDRIGVSATSRYTRPWHELVIRYYYAWLEATLNDACRPGGLSLFDFLVAQLGVPVAVPPLTIEDRITILLDAFDADVFNMYGFFDVLNIYLDDSIALCNPYDPTGPYDPDWVITFITARLVFRPEGFSYFLDATPSFPAPNSITGYPLDEDPSFTVIVPDPADLLELCVAFRLNPENAWVMDPNTGAPVPRRIAINFFDFSQEPSHEYVELVNVTDEALDLSGWTLEVGIPDPPGALQDPIMKDPYKSTWRVPSGTLIAPRGHLLLGFDAFDHAWGGGVLDENGDPVQGLTIGRNGMGLAAGTAGNGRLEYVTQPPIADTSSQLDPLTNTPIYAPLDDLTGSVFRRNVNRDYIDNTGDGLSSAHYVFNDFVPEWDTDNVLDEYRTHGLDDGSAPPAWSRIVQLENTQLWRENGTELGDLLTDVQAYLFQINPYATNQELVTLSNVDSLQRLARLVLRGGVLPNYPERDGIDNDGDGGYVTRDTTNARADFFGYDGDGYPLYSELPLLRYVPGTLDKDMVDNNLDGRIDSRGVERPAYTPLGDIAYLGHGNPFLGDGVDEGRLGVPIYYNGVSSGFPGYLWPGDAPGRPRQYGPGSFEAGLLPQVILNTDARQSYALNGDAWPYDASWIASLRDPLLHMELPEAELGFPWWETGISPTIAPPPVLSPQDSPEWKAFVERRWNPGDNVIVTLYVGDAREGRVADQVTYREYDIINRTLDDVVESPYVVSGFRNYDYNVDGNIVWLGSDNMDRVSLDTARPTFWPPDHMGLDFYRSLERKHPLYHGDRFGLANRWTPTSGAYDDWAESLSVFEAREFRGAAPQTQVVARFQDINTLPVDIVLNNRLFGHAFWGSPLRMNTMARLWENPPDLRRIVNSDPQIFGSRPFGQFVGSDRVLAINLFSAPDEQFADGNNPDTTRHNVDYALHRAHVPNRAFATLGELMALPQLQFHEYLHQAIQVPTYSPLPGIPETWYYQRLPRSLPNIAYTPRGLNQPNHIPRPGDVLGDTADAVWRQDATLLSATLAQAAVGGAKPPEALRDVRNRPEPLAATPLEISAMNPVILTVGQARVAPLWPAPDAEYPIGSGQALPIDDLRALFQWSGKDPSHMWTPVYLFGPPDPNMLPELHWREARYPRRLDTGGVYALTHHLGDSLISPRYLFNGLFMENRLGYGSWPEIGLSRWPVREVASIIATDYDPPAASDRAAMYVSRHRTELGDRNRAETLFVWDRDTGLENGTYIAYVGTFIPGMARRLDHANTMALTAQETLDPDDRIPFLTGAARTILELDPDIQTDPNTRRFETTVALEFITDRRYAETMLPAGYTGDAPGLPHPQDWAPYDDASVIYRARDDGYIFYSADPHVQWRPIPVRVTNNYLALRVRNMGAPGQVACVTHVVLAPAPRDRGQINLNTAETHRVVRGVTGENWQIELFNAIMGLPAVINTFRDGTPQPGDDIGLPNTGWFDHDNLPDPWRQRWTTPEEQALLTALAPLPPPITDKNPPLLKTEEGLHGTEWNEDREGRAMVRLMSLIAGNRPQHPEGRYYTRPTELLQGISVGGMPVPDGLELGGGPAPWPLSNLGMSAGAGADDIRADTRNLTARRYDEIMLRFSRLSNITTTRSDVFEIIAVVQAGGAADQNNDGVVDYRGDEFYPMSETRARIIYDRRARTIRMDEARELGQ